MPRQKFRQIAFTTIEVNDKYGIERRWHHAMVTIEECKLDYKAYREKLHLKKKRPMYKRLVSATVIFIKQI